MPEFYKISKQKLLASNNEAIKAIIDLQWLYFVFSRPKNTAFKNADFINKIKNQEILIIVEGKPWAPVITPDKSLHDQFIQCVKDRLKPAYAERYGLTVAAT